MIGINSPRSVILVPSVVNKQVVLFHHQALEAPGRHLDVCVPRPVIDWLAACDLFAKVD
jgi:hypothetical protein